MTMAEPSQTTAGQEPAMQRARTPEHSPPPAHRRVYQACIPCRQRKVRCDLGPVDDPLDPPCRRCRREHKKCYFSATRRRRRGDSAEDDIEDDNDDTHSNRGHGSSEYDYEYPRIGDDIPVTPGGSAGRSQPLQRPASSGRDASDEQEEQAATNGMTGVFQGREIYNIPDALHVAYEASEAGNTDSKNTRALSIGSLPGPAFRVDRPFPHNEMVGAPKTARAPMRAGPSAMAHLAFFQQNAKRRLAGDSASFEFVEKAEGLGTAIKAWKKLRFVRAGWFTAKEGIYYIDYFYRFLSPLTPITLPNFHHPKTHSQLLTEEPVLAITLLTIASRYMGLSGPGAVSRAYAIHEKLWNYLQSSIDRMIWGQEQFGGGFCGAGLKTSSDAASNKGLRGLGTIESLLLLTEWHTRALHFPPGDDNDELIITGDDPPSPAITDHTGASPASWTEPGPNAPASVAGRRIDSWLEPCWRSDRMCWSLLSNAQALAYELGIMDTQTREKQAFAQQNASQKAFVRRCENIRRLLYVYITQTSGRLSLPSMIPSEHCRGLFPVDPIKAAKENGEAVQSVKGDSAIISEPVQDVVLFFWHGIATMFAEGNKALFSNIEATRSLVASGRYAPILDELGQTHVRWRESFDNCELIPPHMRHILIIEYEYMRVYTNGVALQAVVKRCTNHGASPESGLVNPTKLSASVGQDRKYIEQITSSSRNLLRAVVEGLLPEDYLKHAPVRTYFRVISVSMILLKTFILGATETDVAQSLRLLDQAAQALSICIVDDVHVGSRFAELLSLLTHRVRSNIVRVAGTGNKDNRSRHSTSATPPVAESARVPVKARPAPITTPRHPGKSNGLKRSFSQVEAGQQESPQRSAKSIKSPMMLPPQPQAFDANIPQPNGYLSPFNSLQEYNYDDPLYGISPAFYDPNNANFSIMPPPFEGNAGSTHYPRRDSQIRDPTRPPTATMYNNSPGGFNTQQQPGGNDWLAIPMDGLLNNGPVDITQTSYGLNIDNQDMLDVLLSSDSHRFPPSASHPGQPQPPPPSYTSAPGGYSGGGQRYGHTNPHQ